VIESTDWQESGTARMSRKQQNLLNAACGDLALAFPRWHGMRFGKNDYRHLIAAVVLGDRIVPGINTGEGDPGMIRMSGRSSDFTKSEATQAIRLAFDIGDNPEDQGLPKRPCWGPLVCRLRFVKMEEAA
jgi:hypothetical protein